MDSILNWYREEGLIFKGGSGAGLNLSRIRSSKELLSSGGTASGPVSFMRGADASAGTIKSGGATRRAAKMVVLDVDHPDIEEFIETKAKEEAKIRVLRDAGFDMDLGGSDITSVQYQNANNSIRVSDEFMHAVEGGNDFGLRARHDRRGHRAGRRQDAVPQDGAGRVGVRRPGHPVRRHDQRLAHLPRVGPDHRVQPVQRVHAPGQLQLQPRVAEPDEVPARRTARSTRSCSRSSVELVITAMDISICFADFPTEPIADTTRKFRQLGIGYANLGALLMATGHAYDSEGGRALAASITSLMTGTAYRRSAELAGVVGPYDGYARNAEAHQRVMRKHAAANDLDPHLPRQRRRDPAARDPRVAARPADRRRERLAQRPGVGARADRHHRPDDGLRHHRDRAGPRAGEVQEAGRRRLDADRQPDRAARAARRWATRTSRSRRSSSTSPSTATSSTRRACATSTTRCSTARWASARSRRWATCG